MYRRTRKGTRRDHGWKLQTHDTCSNWMTEALKLLLKISVVLENDKNGWWAKYTKYILI